jgi:hypothetical protein
MKLFKYDPFIIGVFDYTFIVEDFFQVEALNIIFNENEEDLFQLSDEYSPVKHIESLQHLLNPLNFPYDNIVIEAILISQYNYHKGIYNIIDNDGGLLGYSVEFLPEKITIARSIKTVSFGDHIKKFKDYNSNNDNSKQEIIDRRVKFSDYFKTLPVFDPIAVELIDKYIFNCHFERKVDKYMFQKKLGDKIKGEFTRMKTSLVTIKNAIWLEGQTEAHKNIEVFARNTKGRDKINISLALSKAIIEEIKTKTQEILKTYNAIFDPGRYVFLLHRNSKKHKDIYDSLIQSQEGYLNKLKILKIFFTKKISNFSNGIYSYPDDILAKRLHRSFHYIIESSLKLDFLIMEILQFAEVEIKYKSCETNFLPEGYKTISEFASDRQDEFDRKKMSWVDI